MRASSFKKPQGINSKERNGTETAKTSTSTSSSSSSSGKLMGSKTLRSLQFMKRKEEQKHRDKLREEQEETLRAAQWVNPEFADEFGSSSSGGAPLFIVEENEPVFFIADSGTETTSSTQRVDSSSPFQHAVLTTDAPEMTGRKFARLYEGGSEINASGRRTYGVGETELRLEHEARMQQMRENEEGRLRREGEAKSGKSMSGIKRGRTSGNNSSSSSSSNSRSGGRGSSATLQKSKRQKRTW